METVHGWRHEFIFLENGFLFIGAPGATLARRAAS
jgi:hypothetical protein